MNILRNEPACPVLRLDLSSRDELSGMGDGIRPLSIYEQLSVRQACPELACPELAEGMKRPKVAGFGAPRNSLFLA